MAAADQKTLTVDQKSVKENEKSMTENEIPVNAVQLKKIIIMLKSFVNDWDCIQKLKKYYETEISIAKLYPERVKNLDGLKTRCKNDEALYDSRRKFVCNWITSRPKFNQLVSTELALIGRECKVGYPDIPVDEFIIGCELVLCNL